LDRILEFAGETGLAVILHNDIDIPFQEQGEVPAYRDQLRNLALRHPDVTLIWAHIGLGRVIFPPGSSGGSAPAERGQRYLDMMEEGLKDPSLNHILYDISWDELAKYIVASPESVAEMARIINRYPDRVLFGTDIVAPRDEDHYLGIYRTYKPLWQALTPEARQLVLKGNYERVFDTAAASVRAWEAANVPGRAVR
jgi:predicted TIM-barrel fold metal-dependent hydrolase